MNQPDEIPAGNRPAADVTSADKKAAATESQNLAQSPTKSFPTRPADLAATELHDPAARPAASLKLPCRFGDYELLAELGKGGMGVVYKARQRSANRVVALKLIRPDQLSQYLPEERRQVLARFRNEVQAAAQLEHDHVVTVYDVGEIEGQSYYAMRFVDGESLKDRLNRGPLEPEIAARYIEQVARALAEAHARGILHRDLKPHNVMLDIKSDRALLADFGLAKLGEGDQQLTATASVFGSPPYMSPEQTLDSGKVTAASDIYGLGATLYHLLTGRPPFQAANAMATMVQVQFDEPVSPRILNPAVPLDLETICLKCLEKDPGKRYASALEVADRLGRVQRGEAIPERPIGRVERFRRWRRKNPVVAGLSAAVVVALLVGTAVSSTLAVIAQRRSLELSAKTIQLQDTNSDLSTKTTELQEANQNLSEKTAALEQSTQKLAVALTDAQREQKRATEQEAKATQERDRAVEEEKKASQRLYNSQIARAQQLWNDNATAGAWQQLRAIRGDLREWEYDYLFATFTRVPTLKGHTGGVGSVAFSRDGQWIVSGSGDNTLKVWDAASGEEIRTLKGHTEGVSSVAFSPDGKRIVSGSHDKMLKVWVAASSEELRTLKGHINSVRSVAFSPDGKRIVSGSDDKTLKVWDSASGEDLRTLKGHTREVSSVAFSPDGKRIVSGSHDGTLKMWDAASGEELRTLQGHTQKVSSVAFSPDGQRIVSGSDDSTLRVWDAASGEEIRTLKGHTFQVSSVAFSPDGKRIVSSSMNETLKLWDAESGEEIRTLKGHMNSIPSPQSSVRAAALNLAA